MSDVSSSGGGAVTRPTVHRPGGGMLWLQVFITGFFLTAALILIAVSGLVEGAAAASLPALLFLALGSFFLLNTIGFRSQHLTLSDDALSFRLPRLSAWTVFPWKLQRETLAWNSVRTVDVKLRNLGGPQRVYVLRTAAGDFVFFWPQWSDADAIAAEICRRSGASATVEDMNAPAVVDPSNTQPLPASTAGERVLRGCGNVTLVLCAIFAVLGVIALFGAEPGNRWNIARMFIFLAIAASAAAGLRRYRKIR